MAFSKLHSDNPIPQSVDRRVIKDVTRWMLTQDPTGLTKVLCPVCSAIASRHTGTPYALALHARVPPEGTDEEEITMVKHHLKGSVMPKIDRVTDQFKLWRYHCRITMEFREALANLYMDMAKVHGTEGPDALRLHIMADNETGYTDDFIPTVEISRMLDKSPRPIFWTEIDERVDVLRRANYFPFFVLDDIPIKGHHISECISEQEWYIIVMAMAIEYEDPSLVRVYLTDLDERYARSKHT